jgi:ABC-2 type transport system permease protein
MSDDAPSATLPRPARALPILWRQTKADIFQLLRLPGLLIAGIIFPIILFGFLGLMHTDQTLAGIDGGQYVLAAFSTFATTNVMMLAFGLGLSMERALGIDMLMRSSPLPSGVYVAAKTFTAMAMAFVSLLVLLAFGTLVVGIDVELSSLLPLILAQIVGAVPFAALGLAIGYSMDPGSANAVLNLLYLLLGFLSGILIPISELPGFVQVVAPLLPTFRHAELSWAVLGAQTSPVGTIVLWLVGYSVVFFALAVRAYAREQRRKFS